MWVLPLSAAVCWVSCYTTFGLLKQARETSGSAPYLWLAATGAAAGAGIWSTHFIAMLGYDPGLSIGYDLRLTLISLLVAVVAASGASMLLLRGSTLQQVIKSAVLLTIGIAAMHFTGMVGVLIPGHFSWDYALIGPAISLSLLLTCAALFVFVRRTVRHPRIAAATLLSSAIGVLHFVSMAGAEAVADPLMAVPESGLAREVLAFGIAAVMFTMLGVSALTMFADRLRRANRALAVNSMELRRSEERLRSALDAGSDGLWDWNIATGESWFSDRWTTMLGYSPGELLHHVDTWRSLIHPLDEVRALDLIQAHFDLRLPTYEFEHRLRRKSGEWGWVLARGKVVERDPCGRPVRMVGTHIDIQSRKLAEHKIAHMARYDNLTGLENRAYFNGRLLAALDQVEGSDTTSCAVMILDLDRFKAVNDTHGHMAGDQLLKRVSARISEHVHPDDAVARLGGDEFAILVISDPSEEGLRQLANALIPSVSEPFSVGSHLVEVGLSIGIAAAPQHGTSAQLLFSRADLALYQAKAGGRSRYRIFDWEMDEAIKRRHELQRDLAEALETGALELYYQPQVNARSSELIGFEALVRWKHHRRGQVSPSEFIPLAEETGLISKLGAWVLRTACTEAARWPSPIKVAVNLSAREFHQSDLASVILQILEDTRLPPTRLEIEITETAIFVDQSRARSILQRLKALGVSIAIDDFGTGYASLATLQAFPFDKIKIDRSFVGQVETNPQAAAIVRAVLGLGRSLGIGVVAEGVETAGQMQFLVGEKCDEIQGYLIGRPQPAERYASAISAHRLDGSIARRLPAA